jgi:hypothetical protein
MARTTSLKDLESGPARFYRTLFYKILPTEKLISDWHLTGIQRFPPTSIIINNQGF